MELAYVTGRLGVSDLVAVANTRHGPDVRFPFEAAFETRVPGGFDRLRDRRESVAFLKALGGPVPSPLPSREHMLWLLRLREGTRALAEGDIAAYRRRVRQLSHGVTFALHETQLRGQGTAWDAYLADLLLPLLELYPRRDRLKVCGNAACSWLFVDDSPRGARVYCSSQRCAGRLRMRRFRRRNRT